MSPLLESLAAGFDSLALRDAAGLEAPRRAALGQALETGLPAQRRERWKYTSLRALERRSFVPAAALPAPLDVTALALPAAPRLVFSNGRCVPGLSDLAGLPDGVGMRPLSQALREDAPQDLAFLLRRFDTADDVFAQLNTALAEEGAVLRVAPGVTVEVPLHLVFIGTPVQGDASFALRHRIELGAGARLALVEQYVAAGAHANLCNALAQIELAPGAQFEHLRVQSDATAATHFLRTEAVLAETSAYRRLDLELGAALSRHELNVGLRGTGAQLRANGVLLGDGRRHLDTRLGIAHVARDTTCLLEWRGLGAQRSRAVFHGGILIQAGADGTDARLSNKNLLLSAEAEIDTQPVLEIHADEVQAAHGATVGSLDAAALFYLRSRGIPEAQAHRMLTAAFCREVLSALEGPLREAAESVLDSRLDALA
jgi:Fe-S cluster assembly protein SufD